MFNIVLYQPEIPQNTGNIARLCAATGSSLHLVEPLAFFLDDKHLRRAGLDYWPLVPLRRHLDFQALLTAHPGARWFFFTTKSQRPYHEAVFQPNDFLVFGPETRGLPAEVLSLNPRQNLRIPMIPGARSLNLANSVAIVLYEALRQTGFPGFA